MDSPISFSVTRKDARIISKKVEDVVFDSYSKGLFVPHSYTEIDGINKLEKNYTSNPDSEAILASVNLIQSDEFLIDFKKPLMNRIIDNSAHKSAHIYGIKITVPHKSPSHNTPLPHPRMTKKEILEYKWPGSKINEMSDHYVGHVWIDVGERSREIDLVQNEDGSYPLAQSNIIENWEHVLIWPIMVGSNKCNYNIMRSYLNDNTPMIDPDTNLDTTYGERAKYILEDLLECELQLPDGYYIINGRMKKVSIIDKLQMNMIYTIKGKAQGFAPLNDIISEIRSVHPIHGITLARCFLVYSQPSEKAKNKGSIFKQYNSEVHISISKVISELKHISDTISTYIDKSMNIFDLANLYASIIIDSSPNSKITGKNDEGADLLFDEILSISGDDPDIISAMNLTYEKRNRNINNKTVFSSYIKPVVKDYQLLDDKNKKLADLEALHKILPHCEDMIDSNYEQSMNDISIKSADKYNIIRFQEIFLRKIRIIALMAVNLILTTSNKLELTNRKDFSYKRWSTFGYELREYLRKMLSTIDSTDIKKKDEIITGMKKNMLIKFKGTKNDEKEGFVEDIPKWNLIAMLDSIRAIKISSSEDAGSNTGSARRIHTSQWGAQCPVNTPEGKNIGLTNNLAEATLISVELSSYEMKYLQNKLDTYPIFDDDNDDPNMKCLLLIDGVPLKYVHSNVYDDLLSSRRRGDINRQIGLARHKYLQNIDTSNLNVIVVRTTQGRPIFPVFIIDGKLSNIQKIISLINNDEFNDIIERVGKKKSITKKSGANKSQKLPNLLSNEDEYINEEEEEDEIAPEFREVEEDVEEEDEEEEGMESGEINMETSDLIANLLQTMNKPAKKISKPKNVTNKLTKKMEYLLDNEYIEFIDSYEMVHNCVIATWIYNVMDKNSSNIKYTHCMIKPNHITSQATNCLSFYEHNPAARGTYASTHIKQSISRPFKYEKSRYDHECNYLHNPEKPLLSTDTSRRIGIVDIGYGNNIRVAAMSHFGNVDDGIHFSESLVRSGRFNGIHYNILTYKDDRHIGAANKYNYVLNDDKTNILTYQYLNDNGILEIRNVPDPEFSNSVIVPYHGTFNEEMKETEFERCISLPDNHPDKIKIHYIRVPYIVKKDNVSSNDPGQTVWDTILVYELTPGKLYRKSGSYMNTYIRYSVQTPEGNVPYNNGEPVKIKMGEEAINIPGRIITQGATEYMIDVIINDPKIVPYLQNIPITYDQVINVPDITKRNLIGYLETLPQLQTNLQTIKNLIKNKMKEFRNVKFSLSYISENFVDKLDTPYVSKKPLDIVINELNTQYVINNILTNKITQSYHGPPRAPVSKYIGLSKSEESTAMLAYIYKKREVHRGEIAIKTVKYTDNVYTLQKEKFEITYGTIDKIGGESTLKIKCGMPIYPKVGNKYAALYSQKSVCARIVPDNEMPFTKWTNPVTGKEEIMRFDAVFNPLSFPSRGTIGMEYELYIAGTIDYLFNGLTVKDVTGDEEDTRKLGEIYTRNEITDEDLDRRADFDTIMLNGFGINDACELIDEITDTTAFMYDNVDKKEKTKQLRKAIGLPEDGLYECYNPDFEYEKYVTDTFNHIMNIKYKDHNIKQLYDLNNFDEMDKYMYKTYNIANISDLISLLKDPTQDVNKRKDAVNNIRTLMGLEINNSFANSQSGNVLKIQTPIACGNVYYVALRHLVDNKRRARGYVGKKDPITLQPVKGRRRDGGTNTGTMEADACKAHGASAVLYERLALASDYKVFLKCPKCGGLVSKSMSTRSNDYQCIDCSQIMESNQAIKHETVNSWNLFKMYCRSLGIELYEDYDIDYIEHILSHIYKLNIKFEYKKGDKKTYLPNNNLYIYFDDRHFFDNKIAMDQAIDETTQLNEQGKRVIRISYNFIRNPDWRAQLVNMIGNIDSLLSFSDKTYKSSILKLFGQESIDDISDDEDVDDSNMDNIPADFMLANPTLDEYADIAPEFQTVSNEEEYSDDEL